MEGEVRTRQSSPIASWEEDGRQGSRTPVPVLDTFAGVFSSPGVCQPCPMMWVQTWPLNSTLGISPPSSFQTLGKGDFPMTSEEFFSPGLYVAEIPRERIALLLAPTIGSVSVKAQWCCTATMSSLGTCLGSDFMVGDQYPSLFLSLHNSLRMHLSQNTPNNVSLILCRWFCNQFLVEISNWPNPLEILSTVLYHILKIPGSTDVSKQSYAMTDYQCLSVEGPGEQWSVCCLSLLSYFTADFHVHELI